MRVGIRGGWMLLLVSSGWLCERCERDATGVRNRFGGWVGK